MSTDALAYLDDLNEEGRIEYDDYRNLHDLISAETPTDDAQESIRVASPDTWGWDACMVCGSKDVTDRGMMVLFSAKDGVYVSRVAWCDQSQECRDDLRQAGASMLTDQDAKSIDAALRAASTVTTPQGEPSDAQVNRDYLAQVIHKAVYSRIPLDDLTDEAQADTYKRADAVVAALRAAGGVR